MNKELWDALTEAEAEYRNTVQGLRLSIEGGGEYEGEIDFRWQQIERAGHKYADRCFWIGLAMQRQSEEPKA